MTVTGGPERDADDLLTEMTVRCVRAEDETRWLLSRCGVLEQELIDTRAERERARAIACALEAELAEATRDLTFLTDGRWPDA